MLASIGEEWVSVQDAATAVGVSVWTVRRWARLGSIASRQRKSDRRLFVRLADVQAMRALEPGPDGESQTGER